MTETWKTVPGYDGMYEVSIHGRVRSWKRHRGLPGRREESRLLKPGLVRGYPKVNLWKNGRQKTVKVHVLVLTAFIGPCPHGLECCHADGNYINNHLTNLRWDTRSVNHQDAIAHGTMTSPCLQGEDNGRAKLTEAQVIEIRYLFAQGEATHRRLGEKFGVSYGTIGKLIRRESWMHIGG
jgi:hypothetical protein